MVERGYLLSSAKASRIGSIDTWIRPSKGSFRSMIMNIAAATETAHTNSTVSTVPFRGDSSPKPRKRASNQNMRTARKSVGIGLSAPSISVQRSPRELGANLYALILDQLLCLGMRAEVANRVKHRRGLGGNESRVGGREGYTIHGRGVFDGLLDDTVQKLAHGGGVGPVVRSARSRRM